VMVLAQRLAIAEKLAAVIADPRDPLRLVHRPDSTGSHSGDRLRLRGCQRSRQAAL
jgi:hypothetical protein